MFFGREVIEGKTFNALPEMGDKKYYVECKFKGVQAERADMSHTEFNRCEFEGCNFKNAKMQEPSSAIRILVTANYVALI